MNDYKEVNPRSVDVHFVCGPWEAKTRYFVPVGLSAPGPYTKNAFPWEAPLAGCCPKVDKIQESFSDDANQIKFVIHYMSI